MECLPHNCLHPVCHQNFTSVEPLGPRGPKCGDTGEHKKALEATEGPLHRRDEKSSVLQAPKCALKHTWKPLVDHLARSKALRGPRGEQKGATMAQSCTQRQSKTSEGSSRGARRSLGPHQKALEKTPVRSLENTGFLVRMER